MQVPSSVPMAAPSKPAAPRAIATNRQARRDYEILDTYEAGIMLQGSEVKSLREAKVQLADSFARIDNNEIWLVSLHVAPYSHSGQSDGHLADRQRKLLLHRNEIRRIKARLDQERLTLVPLSLYFKDGRAKLELGIGRGRREYDKRQVIAKRDSDRDAARAMSNVRTGKGQ
jgi:SsrA-binding protein